MKRKVKVCIKLGCHRLIVYRNGIPTSKWCPNCTLKRNYEKSSLERAHKKVSKLPKFRSPMQRAIDRADEHFSKYIRLIRATVSGNSVVVECYTCRNYFHIKKMDCGHFIGRGHHTVRWDVNNARPQCTKCNKFQQGKHFEFEQRLLKGIGIAAIQMLKYEAHKIANYSEKEIREISDTFRISVKLIQQEKGIKVW